MGKHNLKVVEYQPQPRTYIEGAIMELEQQIFASHPQAKEIYEAIQVMKRLEKEKNKTENVNE